MWQCPLCKLALKTHQDDAPEIQLSTWLCANKHSFDKAKQGYVNLLPVQNKRSKMPGDDAQMVAARSTFFNTKPYHPLVKKLSELILSVISSDYAHDDVPRNSGKGSSSSIKIYDSGCGEGYYLAVLSALLSAPELSSKSHEFTYSGHDISKPAVLAASKRNKDKQLVVASTINIPVVNDSQDIILQVFAPSCASEYARVLQANGMVITVDPAANHLFELKEMVYEKPEQHQENDASLTGFAIAEQHNLSFDVTLATAEIRLALLQMTPFYWKTNDKQRAHIQHNLDKVTADFVITMWRKSAVSQTSLISDIVSSNANNTQEGEI